MNTIARAQTRSASSASARGYLLWLVPLLVLLTVVGRFIMLDHRPAMHDESMFAFYGYTFFQNGEYTHMPILHGPVQMLGIGTFFRLFGDSLTSARAFIAVCSLVMLAAGVGVMPRRWRAGWALLLITSPILLYYSRYLHEESIFSASLLLGTLGFARQRTPGWRGRLWAALGPIGFLFLLAIKENSVFVYAAGLTYLLAWAVVHYLWRAPDLRLPARPLQTTGPTSGPALTRRERRAQARAEKGSAAPIVAQATLRLQRRSGPPWGLVLGWTLGTLIGTALVLAVYGFSEKAGADTPELQTLSASLPAPLWNIYASWDYWLGQHTVQRIEGAIHYYLPILLVYELPAILALLGGLVWDACRRPARALFYLGWLATWFVVWSVWRGITPGPALQKLMDFLHIAPNRSMFILGLPIALLLPWSVLMLKEHKPLAGWLGWWGACSLFQYSSAGEKVPWLAANIILPLLLVLPWLWGPLLRRTGRAGRTLAIGYLALAGGIGLWIDGCLIGPHAAAPAERIVYNHTTPKFHDYANSMLAQWQRPGQPLLESRRVMLVGDPGWPGVWYFRKFIMAQSCSVVPKFTVMVNGSFGAGNYGMCGRAYDGRFIFSWPNHQIGIMGAEQAANTLADVKIRQLERAGKTLSAEEIEAIRQPVLESFERESTAYYATSQLWDDGILDPVDTRNALGIAISASLHTPIEKPSYGILRL